MSSENYHFELGAHGCIVVNDVTRDTSADDAIANVTKEELAQARRELGMPLDQVPPHNGNVLMVRAGEKNVLIDAGLPEGNLKQGLQAAGITPDDIDMVIITHADGDHIGGLLDADKKPAFPRARIALWRGSLEFWSSEENYQDMPEARTMFGRVMLPIIGDAIDTVEFGEEILPGFKALAAHGHRADHIALEIESDGEKLLHIADATMHPLAIAYPQWYSSYHSFPDEAIATKRQLLDKAAGEQSLVFAAHISFPSVGRVSAVGDSWRWQPVQGE